MSLVVYCRVATPYGWNGSAGSSTLGSGGPAGAADARLSRHEPHSSHDRLRGAAWSRRRTAGTRAELLTPPFGARRTHRPQGEQHRSIRRALVVSVDTAVHRALDVASRPFEPAPHLPPAWHPSAAPRESCSLPAAVRRLAGALALRDVGAPPVCCGLHPRRPRVEGARRRRGWHRASPPSGGACSAWLACACGARSRRSAGAHCALPPEHGRTSTRGASSHRGAEVAALSCLVCQLVVSELIGALASLKGAAAEGPSLSDTLKRPHPARTHVSHSEHTERQRERARARTHIPYTLHILSRRTRALSHTPPSAHPSPGGP